MLFAVAIVAVVAACSGQSRERESNTVLMDINAITSDQWQALAGRTYYFGHQSLGRNILEGLREVSAERPELKLRIASGLATALPGVLNEFEIGENGDPGSKNAAFVSAMQRELGPQPVVMFKYCFADVDESMDPQALFAHYQQTVAAVRTLHPDAIVVHFTFPLTTDAPFRNWVNSIRGRPNRRTWNGIRSRYNELLRAAYAGREPIFDIAAIEATRLDGTVEYAMLDGRRVYAMAKEWTFDEGHLNDAGSRRAAEQLLITLASLRPSPDTKARSQP